MCAKRDSAPSSPSEPLRFARALAALPHRRPREGRDYWILDDVLPDPGAVLARTAASTDWAPARPGEAWPGLRIRPALLPDELAALERKVCARTGILRLKGPRGPDVDHNCLQMVGEREAGPKPHTDSRGVCELAAVLYLLPGIPERCGTSFYRVRLGDGKLGGNMPPPGVTNLVEALGTRRVPGDLFVEEQKVPARFNRLLVYQADLLHSASAYCGVEPAQRRKTAVFFWAT